MFESSIYFEALKSLEIIHSDSFGAKLWEDLLQVAVLSDENEVDRFRPLPLGKMNEFLFGCLLEKSNNYEVLDRNYQFIQNGVTVGEIDFLLKDLRSQEIIHLELATKVYLSVSEGFVGPNMKDNLMRKVAKFDDQISKLDELWKKWSHELGMPVKHSNLILGRVWESSEHTPHRFRVYSREYLLNMKDSGFRWYLPSKKEWFVDQNLFVDDLFGNDLEKINQSILQRRSPLVIFSNGSLRFSCFITFWKS